MAEGRIDDGLDDFRRGVGLADPFNARIRPDADENGVLRAGRPGFNMMNAQDLADDLGDLHVLQAAVFNDGYL